MKQTPKSHSQTHDMAPRHTDYLVWKVMKDRQNRHDRQITRAYNRLARRDDQTRH